MARSRIYDYNGVSYYIPSETAASLGEPEKEKLVALTIRKGRPLTTQEIYDAVGGDWGRKEKQRFYNELINANSDLFGFDASGATVNSSFFSNPQEAAFDSYYRDLFSTDPGTTGGTIYNAFVNQEQDTGRNTMLNAAAMMNQEAVNQAATVKALTDQVRSERMARLRAGMSESQIANQDMTQLMSNINALNEKALAANQAYLQGQQQYNNAQNTAYTNWVNAMGQLGSAGSAFAAADAGDAYMQTLKRMNKTKENYITANAKVTGQQGGGK